MSEETRKRFADALTRASGGDIPEITLEGGDNWIRILNYLCW